MYIENGVCYAPPLTSSEECRIIDAKPLTGGIALITFQTGEHRLFDTTQLSEPVFKPLARKDVFETLEVCHGFISWDNGNIDIAPEYVYSHSLAYSSSLDVVSA